MTNATTKIHITQMSDKLKRTLQNRYISFKDYNKKMKLKLAVVSEAVVFAVEVLAIVLDVVG